MSITVGSASWKFLAHIAQGNKPCFPPWLRGACVSQVLCRMGLWECTMSMQHQWPLGVQQHAALVQGPGFMCKQTSALGAAAQVSNVLSLS